MIRVWGEEDAINVCGVRLEVAHGDDVGFGVGLDEAPDVDVALGVVSRTSELMVYGTYGCIPGT